MPHIVPPLPLAMGHLRCAVHLGLLWPVRQKIFAPADALNELLLHGVRNRCCNAIYMVATVPLTKALSDFCRTKPAVALTPDQQNKLPVVNLLTAQRAQLFLRSLRCASHRISRVVCQGPAF